MENGKAELENRDNRTSLRQSRSTAPRRAVV